MLIWGLDTLKYQISDREYEARCSKIRQDSDVTSWSPSHPYRPFVFAFIDEHLSFEALWRAVIKCWVTCSIVLHTHTNLSVFDQQQANSLVTSRVNQEYLAINMGYWPSVRSRLLEFFLFFHIIKLERSCGS